MCVTTALWWPRASAASSSKPCLPETPRSLSHGQSHSRTVALGSRHILSLPEKAGKCPRKQRLQSSAGCFDTCIHDQECPGSEKCCFDGCAMKCFNFQTGKGGGGGAGGRWQVAGGRQDREAAGDKERSRPDSERGREGGRELPLLLACCSHCW